MEEQTLSLPDILFRAKQEQQKKLTGVQEGGGNNYRVVDCFATAVSYNKLEGRKCAK